jgi:hemolysin activation/secretion protein
MRVHPTLSRFLLLGNRFVQITSWLLLTPAVLAQSTPPPNVPPGASEAVEEAVPRPSEIPLPTIPPAPPTEPLLQVPEPLPSPPSPNLGIRFLVRRIEVQGSTVLQAEIADLVSQYEGKEVALEDLLELRTQITQLYIDNGYITSGAFLPTGQALSDGNIQIQVVEGRLEAIVLCLLSPNAGTEDSSSDAVPDPTELDPSQQSTEQQTSTEQQIESAENNCGSAHLRERYVRSRLARIMDAPIRQQDIEEALQLLQINPLIQQVNAELTAGSAPGQNILQVAIREAPGLRVGIGTDNYQSPSIGSEQFSIQVGYDNVLGWGDRISAGYGITEGLDSFNVGYAIPVNAMDGTLSLGYSNDDSLIIETEFEDLEIRSESETFSVGFRQPIIKTPNQEFALGAGVDIRRSTSFLEGEPFSFSLGPEDGQSNVTVIRLSQDWVNRDVSRVLAARSQFSFGIDAFDATVNDTGTDGRFVAWLGQFQYLQQLSSRFVLVSRLNAQLTPDSLLSLERFGFGGAETVRGYRQNQLVTDNGILAATELRFALLPDSNRLQLIPFVEAGHGWNNDSPNPVDPTLLSLGLGLRWLITLDLSVRLDYGVPLIDVENEGNSLQDNGFYFSVRYQPF